jgi:hypothetical protein
MEGARHGRHGDDGNGEEQPEQLTFLSRTLDQHRAPFLCQGHRPWLADDGGTSCTRPLHGTLRGATNVYFPLTRSAIYLPRGRERVPSGLMALFEETPVMSTMALIKSLSQDSQSWPGILARQHQELFSGYSSEQISLAIELIEETSQEKDQIIEEEDAETSFRRAEHSVLRSTFNDSQLRVRPQSRADFGPIVQGHFQAVNLVEKLRETRVFTGFSRIRPAEMLGARDRDRLIWRNPPSHGARWLPAYKVFGEGIYLELDEERLRTWESQSLVVERANLLARRYEALRLRRHLQAKQISPRFLLLHTLAHLLINQLVFDCGYSSAALRERLYVSTDTEFPMAGLLIYTASGDSDGTMGGLVRMGVPAALEDVLEEALRSSTWCSSDPVCMELGATGGQGPDSLNLAACHSCALLPETSCEQFNLFLDRWVVVGDPEAPQLGYFGESIARASVQSWAAEGRLATL